jgi:hypothetical protein
MKKSLLALALLSAVALAMPARAHADFAFSLGLPGFGLFINDPGPPPVAYAPPVYYGPPAYYRPYYRPYYGAYAGYPGRGRPCGRYGRYRGWR